MAEAKARIPALDGLRGIAVLLVLMVHYIGNLSDGSIAIIQQIAIWGWVGVDLFFVLSGFLIGGILMENRCATKFFSTFYLRRTCRIFPLYFLVVILSIIAIAVLPRLMTATTALEQSILDRGGVPFWSYLVFVQNGFIAFAYDPGIRWLHPTWSLAVEEQFYLVLPVVIRFLPPRWLPVFAGAMILASAGFRTWFYLIFPNSTWINYMLFPCRWDSLLIGLLCAWSVRRQSHKQLFVSPWLPIALCVFGVLMLVPAIRTPEPKAAMEMVVYDYPLIAFLFGLLLLAALEVPGLARILAWGPLRWIGRISFAVYLFHQPAMLLVQVLFEAESYSVANHAVLVVLATLLTFAISLGTWHLFERRIIAWGHRFEYGASQRRINVPIDEAFQSNRRDE